MAEIDVDECAEVTEDFEESMGRGPTTSGWFPDSPQVFGRAGGHWDAAIAGQSALSSMLLEDTQISGKPRIHSENKSPDSFSNCSPFSAASVEDGKVSALLSAAVPEGVDYTEFSSAGDDQLAAAEESNSSDSFAVLGDEGGEGDFKEDREIATSGSTSNQVDDKEDKQVATSGGTSNQGDDKEMATSGGTSNQWNDTAIPRKKGGVSALAQALQMEAARKAAELAAIEAAVRNTALSNNISNGGTSEQLKQTCPRPIDLPWIPVRSWGPDGQPITRLVNVDDEYDEEDDDVFVTNAEWRLDAEGGGLYYQVPASSNDLPNSGTPIQSNIDEVKGPNMWQRCFMCCGRFLCCREYEQL